MNPRGTEGTEGTEGAEEGREGSEGDVRGIAHAVIGAAIEVHRVLGPGLFESIYEEALAVELALRSVPFRRQVTVDVEYKGRSVGQARLDMIVAD